MSYSLNITYPPFKALILYMWKGDMTFSHQVFINEPFTSPEFHSDKQELIPTPWKMTLSHFTLCKVQIKFQCLSLTLCPVCWGTDCVWSSSPRLLEPPSKVMQYWAPRGGIYLLQTNTRTGNTKRREKKNNVSYHQHGRVRISYLRLPGKVSPHSDLLASVDLQKLLWSEEEETNSNTEDEVNMRERRREFRPQKILKKSDQIRNNTHRRHFSALRTFTLKTDDFKCHFWWLLL